MRIEISPKARYQLLKITDYYAEWGGMRSVERLLDKIREKQERMLRFPESFPPEPLLAERRVTYRSAIINDYYKMIYRIDGDVITISAFWDMRMHPNRLQQMI
jgi:plasmid stabilization system protein ParE